MLVSGNQLKAARALAGLSQIELAGASGVAVTTISAMERKGVADLTSSVETVRNIMRALVANGVECIDGGRPGVRIMEKP